jgi:hypothetical protein
MFLLGFVEVYGPRARLAGRKKIGLLLFSIQCLSCTHGGGFELSFTVG